MRHNWTGALLLLLLASVARAQSGFAWKDDSNGQLHLLENGKPALVYNYGIQHKAPAPEDRRRCCYFFPVFTPAGVSMLDDFPQDHWHHRGLFWAWPVVQMNGQTYDLWMKLTVQNTTSKTSVKSGKTATLEAHDIWKIEGEDVVRETVVAHVLPSKAGARDMDIELTWEAVKSPVTLAGSTEKGKSYGGFSARFAPREGTAIRADGQVLAKDEDMVPHQWTELEGMYGGKKAVLRIAPDPTNPGAPYQWCLRAYGFVGASFPGRTEQVDRYTLQPGKPVTLKFRVQVRDE